MKQSLSLAAGMEIAYVVKDARKWEVDSERTASEFDASYYRGLLERRGLRQHLCFHFALPTTSIQRCIWAIWVIFPIYYTRKKNRTL